MRTSGYFRLGKACAALRVLHRDAENAPSRSVMFIVSVCAALSFSTAHTGVNTFTSLGPAGGVIHDVAFHPTNQTIAYAAGERGFFRSLDGGVTWELTRGDIQPRVIAVNPIASLRVILLAPGTGLLASNDEGATFNPLSQFPEQGSSITHIAYSRNGAALYATAGDRVYRSINQGSSWELRGTVPIANDGLPISTFTVDPANPAQLYVSVGALERYQSADAGAIWTPWDAPSGPMSGIAIALSDPARMWFAGGDLSYSDEGGANWTITNESSSFAVAVDPRTGTTIYSGGGPILRRSTNNGVDWSDVAGAVRIGEIFDIEINPQHPNFILIASTGGIMRSVDEGNTWTIRNEGIEGVGVLELVASPASDRIYANTRYSGVYAISGETQSVTAINNDEIRTLDPSRASILSEGFAILPGTQDRIFVSLPSGVARSLDSGDSWSLTSHPDFSTERVIRVANVSADGATLLALTRDGVYRSVDSGGNWSPMPALDDARVLTSLLASAPSNTSVAYLVVIPTGGSQPSAIYRTSDAGQQWTQVSSPSTFILAMAVDPRSEDVLYVSDSSRVFRSMNAGQSWNPVGALSGLSILTGALAIDPQNPDVIYAGAIGQVFRSVDAGETWQTILMDDTAARFVVALTVDPLRPHAVYAGAQAGGVREISIQPDLSIVANVPTSPRAYGTTSTYTYTIENSGPLDATRVRTQIQLPEDAAAISIDALSSTCTRTANVVSCVTPILREGASIEISIHSTQPASGDFQVVGSVSADQPDPANEDNTVTSSIAVAAISDISIAMTAVGQVTQGNAIVYTIDLANSGPNDASEMTATIALASGLSVSTVVASAGTCESTETTATCTIPTLPTNASETITLTTLAASAPGSFTTTSTVTAAGIDSQTSNNTAAATTNVIAAAAPPSPGAGSSRSGGGGGGATSPWLLMLLLSLAGTRAFPAAHR